MAEWDTEWDTVPLRSGVSALVAELRLRKGECAFEAESVRARETFAYASTGDSIVHTQHARHVEHQHDWGHKKAPVMPKYRTCLQATPNAIVRRPNRANAESIATQERGKIPTVLNNTMPVCVILRACSLCSNEKRGAMEGAIPTMLSASSACDQLSSCHSNA